MQRGGDNDSHGEFASTATRPHSSTYSLLKRLSHEDAVWKGEREHQLVLA